MSITNNYLRAFLEGFKGTDLPTGWEIYEKPQNKSRKMSRDRKENPQFIESMKIIRHLRSLVLTEEMENQLRAIKSMLIRQNDEIHDLKTALSKSDRKCNALNEMIQCVAEKNGGLKHRIKRLQSLISQTKKVPITDETVSMAWSDIQEAVEIYLEDNDDDYIENLRDSMATVAAALAPAVTKPLVVETDENEGLTLRAENTES